jgi:glutamyl-tRNA synthetase
MMVKVRFAPSPTGYLHIGGARTALFNWLYARHNNGIFVLRIEDTDRERSTKESEQEILESMKWLGLDWDEGPGKSADDSLYYQTRRLPVYHKYAEKLLNEGKAYKCFCTKEELDAERKKAEAEKRAFKYDGRCSRLSPAEVKSNIDSGKPYTVRIKVEQTGETVVNDIVRGEVRVQNSTLDDIIILRTDGMPIYNFVVVVDDVEMGITHVIRGDDHLSNTPKQIHIYKALGFNIPQFAHIPLILGADKSKLSKRHGETSVMRYKEMGFLPEAMVNYLALLGWSPDNEETIFTPKELAEKFDLVKVHKSGAMFDNKKLMHINGVHIRKKSVDELTALCVPYLKKDSLITDADISGRMEFIKHTVFLQQEKLQTLSEISGLSGYFYRDDIEMNDDARKVWEKNGVERGKILEILLGVINEAGVDKVKVEELLKSEMEKAGIKPKAYMHVIRAVLSGTTMGPGLYDIIETLGKEKCLKRIEKAGV